MANLKITQLEETEELVDDDLFETVVDVETTPTNKKVTFASFVSAIVSAISDFFVSLNSSPPVVDLVPNITDDTSPVTAFRFFSNFNPVSSVATLIGTNVSTQMGDVSSDVTSLIGFQYRPILLSGYSGTVTLGIGFFVVNPLVSGGTLSNFRAFVSSVDSGSGRWGLYFSGSADNYLNGMLGLGTASPSRMLDVNDDAIRVRQSKTPASASATGVAGEIAWDSNFIYVCVATNTWKRVAISTW